MNKPDLQMRILKRMKLRYMLAICGLLLAALVTFWLETQANFLKSSDYELINVAGRQRMLSQRLALTAITDPSLFPANFQKPQQIQNLKEEIGAGFDKILKSRFLDDSEISHFYNREDNVRESFMALVNLAERNTQGQFNKQIFELSYVNLLPQLDEAVKLLQLRSEDDFRLREKVAIIAFAFTVLVLILEVMFIFIPLLREVRMSLEEIENLNTRAVSQARLSAMGELTAFISHELSNSLAIVKPTVNMLHDKWSYFAPEKTQSYMIRLKTQVERMEKILKAVKYQARDGAHDPLDQVDIFKVVAETRELLQERCDSFSISLDLKSNLKTALVKAKAAELYQVMANLITNAIDSIAQSAAAQQIQQSWVRLEVTNSTLPEMRYVIRISDSGPGVPPQLEEKIFEVFFTTKGTQGTGLGLPICKKIVEGVGGKMILNPEVCRSCFEIHLP